MQKYFLLSFVLIALSACTLMPEKPRPFTPASGESQVPADAKIQPGYQYPSIPLDQYKAQSQSWVTASGGTASGNTH